MNTSKLIDEEEAFEVMPGCPTLTFVLKDCEHTIPYQSFKSGTYREGKIELNFSSGELTIQGKNLEALWRHFQLLDVRKIQCLRSYDEEEPTILSIIWEEASEDE